MNRFIVSLVAFVLVGPLLASDDSSDSGKPPPELFALPYWVDISAVPEPIVEDPPVYLDVDSKGNVYRLKMAKDKSGRYSIAPELMTESKVSEISSRREIVLQNMEDIALPGQKSSATSTYTCPLPGRYSILGNSNGEAVGFIKVANTNRPPNVTTQWITFDFSTENYRDNGSHMSIVLFHEELVHGWGGFIGDNHESVAGCGASALFNSQIEAWILYGANPQPPSATWQSSVFNSSNSCGSEMYDGPGLVLPGGITLPRYRMEMHASTGHWVSYRILEFQLSSWSYETLTGWNSLDVDLGYWPFPPPVFNNAAEGIFMLATDSPNQGTWEINITNTQCGWF